MLTKSEKLWIKSLQNKADRDKDQVFVAEGIRLVGELLKDSTSRCRLLVIEEKISEDLYKDNENIGRVVRISREGFSSIRGLKTNDTALAVMEKPTFMIDSLKTEQHFILFMDGIQDPGNMGTIIRSADWFGLRRIYCSPDCVDVFNNKAVQASMASVVRVQAVYCEWSELKSKITQSKTFVADMHGTGYQDISKDAVEALVIGNEARGVRPAILQDVDNVISIPRNKNSCAESLNAAIATSILLSWKFA